MKRIYENDKTAPRMKKAQFITNVVSRDLYKIFKKDNEDVSWEEFLSMWNDIAEVIREQTVENPLGVKLPSFTGELKVQYLPYKFKAVDRDLSNELGEQVHHLNIGERGKVAKIKWERRWAVRFNKILQFYAFSEHRDIQRRAKEKIDKDPDSLRMSRNTLRGFSVWRNGKGKPKQDN